MYKVTVQLNAPINVCVSVNDLSEEAILDAVWIDLKNPDSSNPWSPAYDDLKDVIRNSYFEESDWENFVASDEKNWIHAYH